MATSGDDVFEFTKKPGENFDFDESALESVKYVASQFAEDKHLKKLSQTLSVSLNRAPGRLQSLQAAMNLMEDYGVVLSGDEVARISSLADEEQQIAAVVEKMPQEGEQFQDFLQQLKFLVSGATQLRESIEQGAPDNVRTTLDDPDSVRVLPHLLRMSLVQSGQKVASLQSEFKAWSKDADEKMGKLIRGQEDAMSVQKKLAALQAHLFSIQEAQTAKAQKVVMTFVTKSTASTKEACFRSWQYFFRRAKQENAIRAEYQDRIDRTLRKTLALKSRRLENIKSVFATKAKRQDADLLGEMFSLWLEVLRQRKEDDETSLQVTTLQNKLSSVQEKQSVSAKKVMDRIAGVYSEGLLEEAFVCWLHWHDDERKLKEFSETDKRAMERINTFMEAKSDHAKKVILAAVGGDTDGGCVLQAFKAWISFWQDAKQSAELNAKIAAEESNLTMFATVRTDASGKLLKNSTYFLEECIMMKCFFEWRSEWKTEKLLKMYHAKVEAKKQQLVGVQQMFKSFATQLEGGLKSAEKDSFREFAQKRLSRDMSVSLPDIHKPGTPGSRPKSKVPSETSQSRVRS